MKLWRWLDRLLDEDVEDFFLAGPTLPSPRARAQTILRKDGDGSLPSQTDSDQEGSPDAGASGTGTDWQAFAQDYLDGNLDRHLPDFIETEADR